MARKDLGSQTYLYPMPVLVIGTYDEKGHPNAMTAAWGGISDYHQIFICLAEHKTTDNILKSEAFSVSPATKKTIWEADYVGLVSQNTVPDKIIKSGLTPIKSNVVTAPLFKEFPLSLECRLISFNPETGILLGDIVNVSVDESILTNGKIDPQKADFLVYDGANHDYLKVGEVVGKAFAAKTKN